MVIAHRGYKIIKHLMPSYVGMSSFPRCSEVFDVSKNGHMMELGERAPLHQKLRRTSTIVH